MTENKNQKRGKRTTLFMIGLIFLIILLPIVTGLSLNDLDDVIVISPNDGDILRYNSALGNWTNVTPPFPPSFTYSDWFNQKLNTTDAVTHVTLNTGHGANELYAMNQDVRTNDDVTFNTITCTSRIGVKAYLTVNQVIPAGAWTKLNLNNVRYDLGSDWRTITFDFLVPKTGVYQISYSVTADYIADRLSFASAIYVNNVLSGGYEYQTSSCTFNTILANSGSDIMYLTLNDVVDLRVFHGLAPTATYPAVVYSNYIAIKYISC